MSIDATHNINAPLPAALQDRVQTSVPLAGSLLNIVRNPVAVADAVTQNLTFSQQAALLGTDAMQILSREPTSPAEPLLATEPIPDLTTLIESQGLIPAQQGALAVNTTVQDFIASQSLNPSVQAALTVNQATQTLAAPLAAAPETTMSGATAVVAGQNLIQGGLETTLAAESATVVETPGMNLVSPALTPTEIQIPTTEATDVREVLNPSPSATAVQPIPYKNALAVYEIRNPTPEPPAPAPIRKEVHPSLSIGRVRPIDPLVLKQEWDKRNKNSHKEIGIQQDNILPRPPLQEKAIQQMILQTNEDLAASGVPLHLVLNKHDEGFVLDIYDCSDSAVCQVVQEVPVDLNKLLTLLDNLEHEDGIIINIKT